MSAPILVSALGTILAIDAEGRPASFGKSIEATWASSRVLGGTPIATLNPAPDVDAGTAHRLIREEVTRLAVANVRPGIWLLRAVAVADSDGNVILLLCDDLAAAAQKAAHYGTVVSTPLVGIDPTGILLHFREPNQTSRIGADDTPPQIVELPATPRVSQIVVVGREGLVEGVQDECGAVRVAEVLVASSINLARIPDPLRRVADLIEHCVLRSADSGQSSRTATSAARRVWSASSWLEGDSHPFGNKATLARGETKAGGYFRGAALASGVVSDGRCIVLMADGATTRLIRLNDVETRLWQQADGSGRTTEGETGAILEGMLDAGVLVTEPVWRIDHGVAWVTGESRTTVLGSASIGEPVLALEGTAHVIWSVIVDERVFTLSEVVRKSQELFDVDVHELSQAVRSLIDQLVQRGAVVRT